MWNTGRASNLTKGSDELWEQCTDWLSHTMPYVMHRGKISHAIHKGCSLFEGYAAKLVYQIEDEKS